VNGSTGAWTTTTGRGWRSLPTPDLRATTVNSVISAHGRWIAGGSEGDCSSSGAVVYTSVDGRSWQRGAGDPARTNRDPNGPVRYVTALSPTTTGAIAVVTSLDAFTSDATGPDIWLWTPRR
jgi:hypothetical protein